LGDRLFVKYGETKIIFGKENIKRLDVPNLQSIIPTITDPPLSYAYKVYINGNLFSRLVVLLDNHKMVITNYPSYQFD
jgi:hypothetical protein